jgi:hypothetical protein
MGVEFAVGIDKTPPCCRDPRTTMGDLNRCRRSVITSKSPQLGLVVDWTSGNAKCEHRSPRYSINGHVNPAFGAAVHFAQILADHRRQFFGCFCLLGSFRASITSPLASLSARYCRVEGNNEAPSTVAPEAQPATAVDTHAKRPRRQPAINRFALWEICRGFVSLTATHSQARPAGTNSPGGFLVSAIGVESVCNKNSPATAKQERNKECHDRFSLFDETAEGRRRFVSGSLRRTKEMASSSCYVTWTNGPAI